MIENICLDAGLAAAPEKEDNGYDKSICDHDFLVRGELTVTITLSEYRSLLNASSVAKVKEADQKRWDAERKRDELQKELENVKKQLADLKAMFTGAALEAVTNNKEASNNE